MGMSKDGAGLILMLADHLDWESEEAHLILLQDKINAYLAFIETEQYTECYSDVIFNYYVVEIRFKFQATEKCVLFIEEINAQLKDHSIHVLIK